MAARVDVMSSKTSYPRANTIEIVLMFLACAHVAACDGGSRPPRYFGAKSITAWVVDAETGTPVDNANVIAAWQLVSGMEGNPRHHVMVMEAVTDQEGRFHLPAWGPTASTDPGQIESLAPLFTIFKSGYRIGMGSNMRRLGDPNLHMTSIWNGKTFKLERFSGTADEYDAYLDNTLTFRIRSLQRYGCHAKSIPRFLLAVDRQSREFDERRTTTKLGNLQYFSDSFASVCGPIAASVREAGR